MDVGKQGNEGLHAVFGSLRMRYVGVEFSWSDYALRTCNASSGFTKYGVCCIEITRVL